MFPTEDYLKPLWVLLKIALTTYREVWIIVKLEGNIPSLKINTCFTVWRAFLCSPLIQRFAEPPFAAVAA